MSKILIISAHDFGWDDDTVNSTIDLFEKGILTSATIITDMPGSQKAIEYAKANQDKYSFGLRFNIVDAHRAHKEIDNSLTEKDEPWFKSSNKQRKDALLWRLKKSDIQEEFEYQLSSLIKAGINVSHIDSNGNLHKFPQIVTAIRPMMRKYNINTIGIPQNHFQSPNIKKSLLHKFFRLYFIGTKHVDNFFILDHHNDKQWFSNFLENIQSGITELGIHPGTIDKWRQIETNPFLEKSVYDKISNIGIKLENYYILDDYQNNSVQKIVDNI